MFNNNHFNTIYLGLIFDGYSKEDAYNITVDYINSCINMRFLILYKMIK